MRKLLPLLMLAIGWNILSPHILYAQDAMTPPPVPDQVKKFYPYVGDFKGPGTSTMGTKTSTVQVHHVNTIISGGYGIELLEDATMSGSPDYHAVNIVGYDPSTAMVHLYSVDSYGGVHDFKGAWKDANTIILRYEGTMQGKAYVEERSCTLNGVNGYTITSKSTLGADQYGSFQATLRRTSAPTMPSMPGMPSKY